MSKDKKKEVHCYFRMKRSNGLYAYERLRTDGEKIIDIKTSVENLFEITHENLSTEVRNDLALGKDFDDRPF